MSAGKGQSMHHLPMLSLIILLLLLPIVPSADGRLPEHGHHKYGLPDSLPMPQRPKSVNFGTDALVHEVTISKEHGLELYQRWTEQAFSSLLACVGNNKLKELKRAESKRKFRRRGMPIAVEQQFGECSKHADSVPLHAKCVSRLLKGQFKRKDRLVNLAEKKWVGGFRLDGTDTVIGKNASMLLSKRGKRAITQASQYQLKSPTGMMTPLGSIAKMLMKQVLAAKNKTEADVQPWQKTVEKLKVSAKKRVDAKNRAEKELENAEDMESMAFKGLRQRGVIPSTSTADDIQSIVENPAKLKEFLNRKRGSRSKQPMDRLISLLRDGIKLGYSLAGKNTSGVDEATLMKFISPRFMSVIPEADTDTNKLDFLSPSLFSLHNEGVGVENLTSIPSLMQGFALRDQQEWLNLIMEAAGVVEQADQLEKDQSTEKPNLKSNMKQYMNEIRSPIDGTPLYFTKENVSRAFGDVETRRIDTYEALDRTYSPEQLRELNRTGYALMRKDQLEILYGPQSPYNNSVVLKRLSGMNESTMRIHMEKDIHLMAEMRSFDIKQRDTILSPISFTFLVFQSAAFSNSFTVLSPLLFAPVVLSPAVLGPIILSPFLFAPVILSPRVLGPLILNPLAFVPLILSPFVLHPFILVPGIFNPVVLSPLVLSPLILSPQAFTPLILSPLVLSPLILTPTVGSPLVLNPFVLSPIIASPQFLGALVLSPYALSPVIYSPLIAYSVILSPSYLS